MEAILRLASGGSTVEQFARDVYIKSNLTSQLNSILKSLHKEHADTRRSDRPEERRVTNILSETSSPSVADVCNCLEAAILHGLKEKLSLTRVTAAVLGPRAGALNSAETEYQLDFWPVVLILCHNQVSESLMRLISIGSDIGRCRAWLRLTLNEGLFTSYLEALTNDTSLLHGFYRSSAYLRDREHMDVLKSLLDGLDALSFQLNYDCSSLNSWSEATLKYIGVSLMPSASPVMPAIDAVTMINQKGPSKRRKRATSKRKEPSPDILTSDKSAAGVENGTKGLEDKTGFQGRLALEEETLSEDGSIKPPEIVITPDDDGDNEEPFSIQLNEEGDGRVSPDVRERLDSNPKRSSSDTASVGGNSIDRKSIGWSSSPPVTVNCRAKDESYESMLKSYSTEVVLSSTPDMKDITNSGELFNPTKMNRSFSLFHPKTASDYLSEKEVGTPFGSIGDFEVIPKSVVLNNAEPETQEFLLQLPKLGTEVGLDDQDYKCNSCGRPIGMIYGKSRVCKFDGFNYCQECHILEESVIPSKIVHNWDFRKYPVGKRNRHLLLLTESEPLLDIKNTSPILYSVITELKECLDLRTQLFYLHAYLFTCQEEVALELRKQVWPKEHLFEHIHLYSCSDLFQVQSGALSTCLKKAIAFARKHVLSCLLCSQKGFICEICKSSQIIYPFDTKITHRCDNCKAVFHLTCVFTESGQRSCPRCLRIEMRQRSASANV